MIIEVICNAHVLVIWSTKGDEIKLQSIEILVHTQTTTIHSCVNQEVFCSGVLTHYDNAHNNPISKYWQSTFSRLKTAVI